MTTVEDEPVVASIGIAAVLAALADPVRLAYVRSLARSGGEAFCGEVLRGSEVTISKSTLSHHLRVLHEAGLTSTRMIGTRKYVRLRAAEFEAVHPGFLAAVVS